MTLARLFEQLGRRLTLTPRVAIGLAIALLIAGLGLALHNENLGKAEKVRQASVQVQILAGTLAAPLAFDDITADPGIYERAARRPGYPEAAAAYDSTGQLGRRLCARSTPRHAAAASTGRRAAGRRAGRPGGHRRR